MNASHPSAVWTTESNPGTQAMWCVLGLVVGAFMVYVSRSPGLERVTSLSALLLGCLVVVVAMVTLVKGGKQVISIDPRRRLVEIQTHSRFGSQKRVIPFRQIVRVELGEHGDREGGSISYHVLLILKDGKEVALFVGAFDGIWDRQAMDTRRARLVEYLQTR